ncbi:MAG: ADP-ribose-binding protein [Desulfuromonas sp.]|nr:MAG: ADP-ribose-binding protein [Desulfuromonas sp.]
MKEILGDLWSFRGKAVLAITTGGKVDCQGRGMMLRGCARQARDLFPGLEERLGAHLLQHGNHVGLIDEGVIAFPVAEDPWSWPEPALIRRSADELSALADRIGWAKVILPRPGCGTGGLLWHEVKPLLLPRLDDRFWVIAPE